MFKMPVQDSLRQPFPCSTQFDLIITLILYKGSLNFNRVHWHPLLCLCRHHVWPVSPRARCFQEVQVARSSFHLSPQTLARLWWVSSSSAPQSHRPPLTLFLDNNAHEGRRQEAPIRPPCSCRREDSVCLSSSSGKAPLRNEPPGNHWGKYSWTFFNVYVD